MPHTSSSTPCSGVERMRIWIVNHYAAPPGSRGGPTRHLGLSRALRDRGHDVTIIASVFDHYSRADHRPRADRGWSVEDIDGVSYVWVSTPPYGSMTKRAAGMVAFGVAAVRTGAALDAPDPDMVVGSSPHLLAAAAAKRIALRRKAPFIMEVRDLWPETLIELGEISARHPAVVGLRRIERHLYRTADEVVTVLPGATSYLLSHGVPENRLHVIPNGVSIGDHDPDYEVSSPEATFTAVYAGTMGLANGLDLVVDAACVLHERGRTDIRIRMVGAGPERDHLAGRAASLPNVTVEPPVPAEEVPAILRQADAGLLVLRDSPLFRWGISPTKLFDYMAASLPVVTSVRAPSDIVSDIDAGMRAEPGDAASLATTLERMADLSSEERREMGARGRAHVEDHHSFEALAARFEAVAVRARARRDEQVPS